MQCVGLDLPVPDYTTLAKRAARLGAALKVRPRRGPIDVVVDSTGLKVYGEKEWSVHQHGKSRRRTWRKVRFRWLVKNAEYAYAAANCCWRRAFS